MKQKQVKAAPKAAKQTKATKKAAPAQKVEEVVEETKEEAEEVVEKKVVAKKAANKKPAKVQKVVEVVQAPEEEEEEEEEDEEVEQQVEDEDQDEAMDEEDADEEEEDENDDDEEAEEDDEAPEEAGVDEEPTIPSKVKSGVIPSTVPSNKIVHVNKLPIKCKKMDIVEVFAKYGAIDQIHITTTPVGSVANVAFKTTKAAKAALADSKKVKVHDSLITISPHKARHGDKKALMEEGRERSIYVRFIKAGTTEEQLREHFKVCGEIEKLTMLTKFNKTFSFVTFVDKSSIEPALQLHNSILNDVNISVCKNDPTQLTQTYEGNLTVMVKNKQNFESIDAAKIKAIFAKCGEIETIDVVCRKNVLAFVCYKTEEAAKKALKLNGKTEQGIELDMELYDPFSKKTTIHITNLPKDCTEEDLRQLFSKAGEIKSVYLKGTFAIIGFENSDAYCKSFLYNECTINNQVIFIEPFSMRKKTLLKSKVTKKPFQKGFKRPAENGKSVFKPKRAKTN